MAPPYIGTNIRASASACVRRRIVLLPVWSVASCVCDERRAVLHRDVPVATRATWSPSRVPPSSPYSTRNYGNEVVLHSADESGKTCYHSAEKAYQCFVKWVESRRICSRIVHWSIWQNEKIENMKQIYVNNKEKKLVEIKATQDSWSAQKITYRT